MSSGPSINENKGGDLSERLMSAFTLPSQFSQGSLADHWLCNIHINDFKRVEAFCSDCRQPLCMGCILTNKHTSHSIKSLPEAKQDLMTLVDQKFQSIVAGSVDNLNTSAHNIEQKLQKLRKYEVSFTNQLDAVFKTLYQALNDSFQ